MSKILVAEDERGTRRIVKRLLEKEGHEVLEASDGISAYELAMAEAPDVGVLDVRMPGMDGFEVLRRLRRHPDTQHMPVVMLTSIPIEKGESTAASFGASHYLPKPLDPKTLRLAVRSALREAETLPQKREEAVDDIQATFDDATDQTEYLSPFKRNDSGQHGGSIGVGDPSLDEKLGGGIPLGSLSLIEGQSSAGKSVLCQHLAYSSLLKGHSVVYITFEDTTQGLISQMTSLGLDVSEFFETNRLRIFPLGDSSAYEDPERVLRVFVQVMEELPAEFNIIVLDAITNVASYCEDKSIMGFFADCKRICKNGRTIMLVAHSYVFDEKLLVRVASLCDVHLKVCVEKMGPKLVKTLEVCKIHNAELDTGNIVSFEVHPSIGMRLNPINKFSV